jgi:hypothetical protein
MGKGVGVLECTSSKHKGIVGKVCVRPACGPCSTFLSKLSAISRCRHLLNQALSYTVQQHTHACMHGSRSIKLEGLCSLSNHHLLHSMLAICDLSVLPLPITPWPHHIRAHHFMPPQVAHHTCYCNSPVPLCPHLLLKGTATPLPHPSHLHHFHPPNVAHRTCSLQQPLLPLTPLPM